METFTDINLANKRIHELMKEIEAREQEIKMLRIVDEKQRQDNENLKSTMVAAAEEIMRCWPDHCDDEGYGPANLMHRLEKGIAANYPGYKFGAFTNMEAKISRLEATLEAADEVINNMKTPVNTIDLIRYSDAIEKYNQLKSNQQSPNS